MVLAVRRLESPMPTMTIELSRTRELSAQQRKVNSKLLLDVLFSPAETGETGHKTNRSVYTKNSKMLRLLRVIKF